jgi:CheY-like chemotaxis protein
MREPHAIHLLIVEDESVVALDLRLGLEDLGYQVQGSAASGEEAIRMAAQRRPDLVLMDIRIRGNLDGIETAAILRRRHDMPVVFLSAHSDADTLGRAERAGMDAYLIKPVGFEELRAAIERALMKHELEPRRS